MLVIKKILRALIPPLFLKLFLISRTNSKVKEENRIIRKVEETGPVMLSLSLGVPLYSVPVEKLRYNGGVSYKEDHHFLKYYRHGKDKLIDFYESHQPNNIFEKHFLTMPDNYYEKYNAEQVEKANIHKPWLYNVNNIKFPGEKGLCDEHGHQAFGPVSEEKLELEITRLERVLNSIKKDGFRPLQYDGYPRGYFLIDKNNNWSFMVRTGFHRVAALIHLGYKRIPFEFQHGHPRIVYESECGEWASVKEGYLDQKDALTIFRQYLK